MTTSNAHLTSFYCAVSNDNEWTYGLIVQASPSDDQSWHSLDVRQSLSSWIASADRSGTTTVLATADGPFTGSQLALTTSSSGSNKIWIISGAFGLWIIPFKLAYKCNISYLTSTIHIQLHCLKKCHSLFLYNSCWRFGLVVTRWLRST